MDKTDTNIARFLKTSPLFAGLSADTVSVLSAAAAQKQFSKGGIVFHQGDRADRVFVVCAGWIKLSRTTAQGEESIAGLFTRGDIFGETSILDAAAYPFTAAAAEDAAVIEIPAAAFVVQAKADSAVMPRLMAVMSREMHKLHMENEHMALMSAPQRVGCLLLQLAAGMAADGGVISFPYDKSLAAQRLGMSPETFSRALAQLKPLGVTVKGPDITVESFSRLIVHSCTHCSAEPGACTGQAQCTR